MPDCVNWSGKADARRKTVIEPYRILTGRWAVPPGRQYWTLCGRYEVLSDGAEIVQMVSSGFVTPDQFHAAESDVEAHAAASTVIGTSYPEARVFHADIVAAMNDLLRRGELNPEIIYLDTMHEPGAAFALLADVLDTVNYAPGRCMVLCNMVVKNPRDGLISDGRHRVQPEWDAIIDTARRNKALMWHAREGGWTDGAEWSFYRWAEAGMATVTLTREERAPALACA